MSKLNKDIERVGHIKDAISDLRKILEGYDYESFNADFKTKLATLKLIEIIGEASNHVSTKCKEKHPEILWKKLKGMRNILVHEYFGVDYEQVWLAIKNDLPKLETQIEGLYDELKM